MQPKQILLKTPLKNEAKTKTKKNEATWVGERQK